MSSNVAVRFNFYLSSQQVTKFVFEVQTRVAFEGFGQGMVGYFIEPNTNNIYTQDGRIPQQMLPFFDFYLDFE